MIRPKTQLMLREDGTIYEKQIATNLCPHGDELCPCPDGDPCHYEGENPMICWTVWDCGECGYRISDIEYQTVRFDFGCPRCKKSFRQFYKVVFE